MSKPEGTFKLKRSKTRGVRRVRWQPMVSASSRMPGWVAAGVADLTGLIGNVTEGARRHTARRTPRDPGTQAGRSAPAGGGLQLRRRSFPCPFVVIEDVTRWDAPGPASLTACP